MSKFTPNAISLLTVLLFVSSTAVQSSTKKAAQLPSPMYGKLKVWNSELDKVKKETK
jgi:hypothetical protein